MGLARSSNEAGFGYATTDGDVGLSRVGVGNGVTAWAGHHGLASPFLFFSFFLFSFILGFSIWFWFGVFNSRFYFFFYFFIFTLFFVNVS